MKKYLLYSILFLSTTLSFAQLTVINDTYIFVDGDGFNDAVANTAPLYVTEDINLRDANSTIYLRDEAQIIQDNDIKNSGLGRLSVYQEGTVHNYAYNYWCSPVGNVSANSSTNRDFIPNQNIYDVVDLTNSNLAGYATTGYNGTSSPLNIEDYWLWKYNPAVLYADWVFVGEGGSVGSGYGFTMKGTIGSTPTAGQQYDFRGKPNTGNITTAIEAGLETLIGNPYPSALDARDFIYDTNNVSLLDSGSLYYWEQDQTISSHVLIAYRGGYGAYTINSDGSVVTYAPPTFNSYNTDGTLNTTGSASTTGKEPRRYIPIGQGFFVKGAAGISAGSTLITRNSHREFYKESGANSEFYRVNNNQTNHRTEQEIANEIQYNDNGMQIMPADYKRFRLNIDFGTSHTRQLVHNFHHTATPNFDYGLESKGYELGIEDANWVQNNEAYVSKADNFEVDLTIPLTIATAEQRVIKFRIFDVQNFETTQPIYLHDILNDTYSNLRNQDFEINLDAGNYIDRFEIVFEESNSLSNEEFVETNFIIFQNNTLNELVIKNPNIIPLKSVVLYDITGKKIFNKFNLNNDERISFSTKNLSDGVYLAKIVTKNNNTFSQKIIIANK